MSVTRGTVFSFPIHAHTYFEMTLYMPFDGCIRINGIPYFPRAPLVSLVAPSDFHVIEVSEPRGAEFVKLGFSSELLETGNSAVRSSVLEGIDPSDGIVSLFREIGRRGDGRYARLLLNAIVCDLTERGRAVKGCESAGTFSFVARVLQRINTDFREDLSLKLLAGELGITPQYLSRVFCKNVGIGFSEYLVRLRLERACLYLRETSLSVTEIAYEVGYRDLSHFMRSFKQSFGMTPLAYRKKG